MLHSIAAGQGATQHTCNLSSSDDYGNDEENGKDNRSTAGSSFLTVCSTVALQTLAAWLPFMHHTPTSAITQIRAAGLTVQRVYQHLITLRKHVGLLLDTGMFTNNVLWKKTSYIILPYCVSH
ncbi:hypothetical protein AOLI_G00225540 [Acnodon oligacanthus]